MKYDAITYYDYELPERLIATKPAENRDESRLMVLDRDSHQVSHRKFADAIDYLNAGDLLVFNDSKVVPARIYTTKPTGGRAELLVTDIEKPDGDWGAAIENPVVVAMTRSSKPVREDTVLTTPCGIQLKVLEMLPERRARLEIQGTTSVAEFLEKIGEMPLPPYIVRERKTREEDYEDDLVRYQTVYARRPGSVAAPTAGLHFTKAILERIQSNGVDVEFVTLEVGPGTFKPVTADNLSEHPMHSENYHVSDSLSRSIRETKARGGRVIAVGTTTVRVLESEARLDTPFEPGSRSTSIMLSPASTFECVDAMFTNFHLPRSTLLALVAGFAGYELMRTAYKEAVEHSYRFYSYGDSMLII